MKHILFTGGGTAGHVTPNIALIQELKKRGCKLSYIGSKNGIEKELIIRENIDYYGINSGKLRRYIDIENIKDVFRVVKGVIEAKSLIKKLKPDIVFSKGGFVSVPVVIGAYINKIPIIIHESDITPGLANKISIKFANKVCASFPETIKYLPKEKAVLTGPPIRSSILNGSKQKGYELTGFKDKLPTILVMGGSLGSVTINKAIYNILPKFNEKSQIVHICGKGNYNKDLEKFHNYKQFEYLNDELSDVFKIADIVISRAGSNSIFEFLAMKKPNILIPLSKNASRGDQILNAKSFEKQGYSIVIMEESLNDKVLADSINRLYCYKDDYVENMEKSNISSGVNVILDMLLN